MVVIVVVQREESPGMLNHVSMLIGGGVCWGCAVGVAFFHVYIYLQLKITHNGGKT